MTSTLVKAPMRSMFFAIASIAALACSATGPRPSDVTRTRATVPTTTTVSQTVTSSPMPRGGSASLPPRQIAEPPLPSAQDESVKIRDGLTVAVRSGEPSALVIDGELDDWSSVPRAPNTSLLVFTLGSKRWWLTLDLLEEQFAQSLAFELVLPDGELPTAGALQPGGSVDYAPACLYQPFSLGHARLGPAQRKRCLDIVARHEAMRQPYAARFRKRFHWDRDRNLWTVDGSPTPSRSEVEACRKTEGRVRCEFAWPLALLPRTTEVELQQVGFRVVGKGERQESTQDVVWLKLPESIAFEAGLEERRVVFPSPSFVMQSDPRYSYQPGEAFAYDLAERIRSEGADAYEMTNIRISRCEPGPVLASLGAVTVRRSCGETGVGLVHVGGKLSGDALTLGARGGVMVRGNEIHVIAGDVHYDEQTAFHVGTWHVARLGADGHRYEPLRFELDQCDRCSLENDVNYSKLKVHCQQSVQGGTSRLRRITKTWVWNTQTSSYEPSAQ